jgi:DNA-binding LacI/PurR family transcriptional regulator/DNA-binding transcriptional regulator YhcF (GntR family)
MGMIRFMSRVEQVAVHLREELRAGRWKSEIPGRAELAAELGINATTVEEALRLLEKEGILIPQGAGRRRKIVLPDDAAPRALRVCFLAFINQEQSDTAMLDLIHRVRAAGHMADFADQSLVGLSGNPQRLERCVRKAAADAWVVQSGSRDVLGWFAESGVPTFALFGRMRGVPIAGVKPDKVAAQTIIIRRLVELGHRRIVQVVSPERVTPTPAFLERSFLEELNAAGISTGPYNLAVWDGTKKGFYERLDALFRHTPPTALLFHAVTMFLAAQGHLARRGIHAPEHVSVVCYDPDERFAFFEPSPAHIQWTFDDQSRRVMRWIENIASGKDDRRQTFTKATFVEGGTIGPVPKGR